MLIVEMARGIPGEPNFATYSAHSVTWKKLLGVATDFGWQPQGTLPDERCARLRDDYPKHFAPTYEVSEWAYCRRFSDADAKAMSDALFAAHEAVTTGNVCILDEVAPCLLSDSMMEDVFSKSNAKTAQVLLSFAEFAAEGGFAFAWDD